MNLFMDSVETNTVGYARAFRLPETEKAVLPPFSGQRTLDPLPRRDVLSNRVGQVLVQV